ncbi:MAG TPA: L,D-transpeptidase family protein [Clostridiaceae bacterium]
MSNSISFKSNPIISPTPSVPGVDTSAGDSEQVIVVLTNNYGVVQGTYATYDRINGAWVLFSSGRAVVGQKGFSEDRTEGDMTTPTGKYGFPFMFGIAANPGVHLEYRQVVEGDYWVSNTILSEYNIWMHYDGTDAKVRLYDFESLWTEPLYKYAALIDYNYCSNKRMNKGSGIFFHIAPSSGNGTAGCVAVSEENLVNVLKWLDPAKDPCIIMGVEGHI